ncbi:MAG TPA: molybdate ABC transporter substrate-binding protein [Ktedonobacteraceae bacterium]|nr:molybdate ABC transporter substrate-binding protein [Ktedonobacteraceae bacterium]
MKLRGFFLCLLLVGAVLLAACGGGTGSTGSTTTTPAASAVTLQVFAAASLTKAFNELADKFHQSHSNVTIKSTFDSSSTLEQQIANGAPADIFASADTANMQKATQASLVSSSQIFAHNRLVVILPASNPGHISTLKDLSRPGVKLVLAAATVPVGKYARQVLANMAKSADYGASYQTAVLKNVVSEEENDSAIVQKVQVGEADAGIVYVSDINPTTASQFTSVEIPDTFNVIADYPIAVTKSSSHTSEAQAFMQFVLSADGQQVLKSFNFIPVTP